MCVLSDKRPRGGSTCETFDSSSVPLLRLIFIVFLVACPTFGQGKTPDWQTQVRKYAEAQDWDSAMRIVDHEVARSPQDMDVRAWRARVLAWSGRLTEAEKEYVEILKVSRNDPDNWMGLASVYSREGKTDEALRALSLDPTDREARAGLTSVRGEPKHELRLGQDNDLFNFASANRDGWVRLTSQWTPHWSTNFSGSFYERAGIDAGKFSGSITGRQRRWGALNVGGAAGHDNAVIPKSEAFFDADHGWKISEANFVRSVEFVYGQHWYWYQQSRILTLNGATILYLPREWTLSLGAT